MTFRDLQKIVQSQTAPEQSHLLQRLRDKPFWIWSETEHKVKDRIHKGDCCFNHMIGLPRKDGVQKPMFDYERLLYDALMRPGYMNNSPRPTSDSEYHRFYDNYLEDRKKSKNITYPFKEKHLWVKKATGLGVTEFFLRLMAWLCLRNDDYRNSQMVIVTGPNQDLAIKLIKRMKALFDFSFDSKETVLDLNGCSIEAYPSNHLDAFRSLTNPKFILLEECDFWLRRNGQDDVRHVSERYIAKSDPFIVMVSTPNAPGGLFESIEREPAQSCIYKKIFLDYTYGLDKIYTKAEIEKAKQSPSFEREYNLKYLGLIGNVFSQQSIDNATKLEYNPDKINPNAKKSVGIDPSYGSSKFAIVTTQLVDGKIQVIFAEEYDRPNFNEMIQKVWDIKNKCSYISNIYVDAANPEIWQALKKEFDERYDSQYIKETVADCKKYSLNIEDRMFVVPTPFSIEGAQMLQHTKWLLEETDEDGSSLIAIHKDRFHKLVTALRTAVANEYRLDKEQTSYNDLLDAFRLALRFFKRAKS